MASNMKIGVFFDLQGTLGGNPLGDVSDFSFYPNTVEALRALSILGIRLFIVTNQSRIAKGLLTQMDFDDRMSELLRELEDGGAHIDKVFCCPHQMSDGCVCRKPSSYFPQLAQKEFDIDLKRSFFVGDIYRSDMGLAKNTGGTGVLVMTGQGRESLEQMRSMKPSDVYERIHISEDILDAVKWIVSELGGTKS